MSDIQADRARDFDRFLTFVDAIVAIAITLLVLPLVEVAGSSKGGTVTDLLRSSSDQIWAFFLSFLVIANLWLTQHRVLHNVVASDRLLLRLMLLWTLTIVVLPFPTALVAGSTGHDAVTKVLYVGTMAVSAVLLALMSVVIGRNDAIRDSSDRPDAARGFAMVAAFLAALAVMLVAPLFSYWPLLLLLLPDHVLEAWRHRHAGRSVRRQPPVP
jgi:uncharacterized membrane protein